MPSYPNAPIVEAVIEFRLRFERPPLLDGLGAFCTSVAKQFPTKVPLNLMAVQISPESGDNAQVVGNNSQIGFRLSSANNDRVLLVKLDGLALSHLAPYSDWDGFLKEFWLLWEAYSRMLEPKAVVRVATRYINKIVVPEAKVELKDYFTISPEVPEGMAERLNGFFVQLRLPLPELHVEAQSVINLAPQPSSPDTCAFLLDIDTFRETEVAPDSDDLLRFLALLRLKKDELFELSITEKTRGLFQ